MAKQWQAAQEPLLYLPVPRRMRELRHGTHVGQPVVPVTVALSQHPGSVRFSGAQPAGAKTYATQPAVALHRFSQSAGVPPAGSEPELRSLPLRSLCRAKLPGDVNGSGTCDEFSHGFCSDDATQPSRRRDCHSAAPPVYI